MAVSALRADTGSFHDRDAVDALSNDLSRIAVSPRASRLGLEMAGKDVRRHEESRPSNGKNQFQHAVSIVINVHRATSSALSPEILASDARGAQTSSRKRRIEDEPQANAQEKRRRTSPVIRPASTIPPSILTPEAWTTDTRRVNSALVEASPDVAHDYEPLVMPEIENYPVMAVSASALKRIQEQAQPTTVPTAPKAPKLHKKRSFVDSIVLWNTSRKDKENKPELAPNLATESAVAPVSAHDDCTVREGFVDIKVQPLVGPLITLHVAEDISLSAFMEELASVTGSRGGGLKLYDLRASLWVETEVSFAVWVAGRVATCHSRPICAFPSWYEDADLLPERGLCSSGDGSRKESAAFFV